jgi:hypothetical protein
LVVTWPRRVVRCEVSYQLRWLAWLAQSESHSLIVAALDPDAKLAGVVCIVEHRSAKFDYPRRARIEVVNSEEELEQGFRIVTMHADR